MLGTLVLEVEGHLYAPTTLAAIGDAVESHPGEQAVVVWVRGHLGEVSTRVELGVRGDGSPEMRSAIATALAEHRL